MAQIADHLQALGEPTLTPVVRRALHNPAAQVDDWQWTKIHEDYNPLTAGVYRVTGTASIGNQRLPWSLVLKIVHWVDLTADFGGDWLRAPTHFLYWQREALAFQSGLLDGWQMGLVPVQCYGVHQPTTDACWLWLEDIQETGPERWTLERHVLAARHLGEFNGHFAQRAAHLQHPWLSRGFLRQWLGLCRAWRAESVAHDAAVWSHPTVEAAFPAELVPGIRALFAASEALLARLEQLPQTLCHLDSDRRNLFARTADDGQDRTVVIDWGFLGLAAVGEDLGNQIGGNLFHLAVPASDAAQYIDAALEAYLSGLQATGWRGEPRLVRFAAFAHQLHYLAFVPVLVHEYIQDGQVPPWMHAWASRQGVPHSVALRQWGDALVVLLRLSEEARHMADA